MSILWGLERLIGAILGLVFRITNKECSDEVYATLMQFAKFGVVGVSNTVISYLLYTLSLLLLRRVFFLEEHDYIIASFIAFVLSVLWSFYWNNKKVFIMQDGERRTLWKALILNFACFLH